MHKHKRSNGMKLKRSVAIVQAVNTKGQLAKRESLENYLSSPQRIPMDILNREELKCLTRNEFAYKLRPINLSGLQPIAEATAKAESRGGRMSIKLASFSPASSKKLEKVLKYKITATAKAIEGHLNLKANAAIEITAYTPDTNNNREQIYKLHGRHCAKYHPRLPKAPIQNKITNGSRKMDQCSCRQVHTK